MDASFGRGEGPLTDHVRQRLDRLVRVEGGNSPPRRALGEHSGGAALRGLAGDFDDDDDWGASGPDAAAWLAESSQGAEQSHVPRLSAGTEPAPGPDWLARLAARRRRGSEEADRADDGTPEAAPRRFERIHVLALAAVAGIGLLITGFAVLSARAVPVEPVAVVPGPVLETPAPGQSAPGQSGPAPGAAEPSSAPPTTAPAVLTVHVTGAVQRPGLVQLKPGDRVHDAIEAAGGLIDDADPAELNLAQPLQDGQQVVVGTKDDPAGEVRGGAGTGSGGGAGPADGTDQTKVNINTATLEQLQQLPGVGPKTAEKILAWRAENGRFSSPEELQEVSGIGPKKYAEMAPLVTI